MPLRPFTAQLADTNVELGAWITRPLYAVIDEHTARDPDRLAVADQHHRLTYAEFSRRTIALAQWLRSLGLPSGAPVAVQSPSGVAVPLLHIACDRANLTFVPLSSTFRHREVGHLLSVSHAPVVIVPGVTERFDFIAMIEELRPELPDVRVVVGLDGTGDVDLREIWSRPVDLVEDAPLTDPNAPHFVMVTSGTTDLPKLSLWTDNNLWYLIHAYGDAVEMTSQDVAVGLAPSNTGSTGYLLAVISPLVHGATSVILEEWSPTAALELMRSAGATLATAIPTQIIKMLQEEGVERGADGRPWSGLRAFSNAGAPMPPAVAVEVDETFNTKTQPLYGSTDGGMPVTTRLSDPDDKRRSTVGRPVPHTELRLVDADLVDVPAGESGEIIWRNPTKTFGYLNAPERTEEAWVGDGFYRSGDLGRIDEDGYLQIVGRVKDVIIRGGQNISPREIEDLAASHPAIAEISVIGVPDPVYGERVCACVVPVDGQVVTLEELNRSLLDNQLAKFKLPERLELFTELPKNSGAKISKVELRALVAARGAS